MGLCWAVGSVGGCRVRVHQDRGADLGLGAL